MNMNNSWTLIDEAWDLYHRIDSSKGSNGTEWSIVSSYSYVMVITWSYLSFVLFIGPRLMKNVPPFNITVLLLAYNFVQIAFNSYLFFKILQFLQLKLSESSLRCINLEPYGSEYYYEVRILMWIAVINKSLDLVDTVSFHYILTNRNKISMNHELKGGSASDSYGRAARLSIFGFFILKKKWTHLTFLHIYHHTLTFTGSWYLAQFAPGGMIVIFGTMNTFVHIIMYSYYFMSACPYFWIKNYAKYLRKTVTQLQITQFTIAGIHALWSLTDETCTYPKELIFFGIAQDVLMLVLFSRFYIKTYLGPKKQINNEIIQVL